MNARAYQLPPCLEGRASAQAYLRWLDRKATAHMRRDRKRGNAEATRRAYMRAIHEAVITSGGIDAYTGEVLAWELISTYNNEESKAGRRVYKRSLCSLPTVDHVGDGLGVPDFKICSWRTNDCKNDLSHDELIEFCRAVLQHHEGAMIPSEH
jgi:hypothetical protein